MGSWDLCRLIVTQKESTQEPKTPPSSSESSLRQTLLAWQCSQGTTLTLWDKSGQLSP